MKRQAYVKPETWLVELQQQLYLLSGSEAEAGLEDYIENEEQNW